MDAIQIRGAHDVFYGEITSPEPGPGEVLIRVKATGICGTDVEIVDGTMPYFTIGSARYPIIPGHEWSGTVAALGPDVTGFEVGDPVVGECSIGCAQCKTCKAGNYHRCPNRHETGILNLNGGFAEYIAFPALYLHKLPASIPLETACLVEPSAVAYNGVLHSHVTPSDYVAIVGDGPIGLLALQCALAFGAHKVVVVGATPGRLQKAVALGAHAIFDANEGPAGDFLRDQGSGTLPDVVIEATGNPIAAEQSIHYVRDGGRLTLLGIFAGQKATIDLDHLVVGDITLRGVLGSPNIWPDVIRLIASGRIDPAAIISHQIELSKFARGIDMMKRRADGVIKVVAVQG